MFHYTSRVSEITIRNRDTVSCTGASNDVSTQPDGKVKGVDTFDFILANLTRNHAQFGKVFSKLVLALESNSDEYLKYNIP